MREKIRKIRKFTVLICVFAMSVTLVACGFDEEDAQDYTRATISIICTGKDNTGTELSDLPSAEYIEFHDNLVDEQVAAEELDSINASEETKQAVREMYEKVSSSVRYDVGAAKKNDDKFKVPVTIHPLNLTDMVDFDELVSEATKQYATGNYTENEIYDNIIKKYAEKLSDAIDDSPIYADDYEISFVIQKDDEGKYTVDEENINELSEHLFILE